MRQLRFYIPPSFHATPLEIDQEYDLPENTAHHIVRVLRMSEGAQVTLFNGNNREYTVELVSAAKKQVTIRVLAQAEVNRESLLTTHLIQSLSKGDKMEVTIQKAVELGVSVIVPVSSERSNVSLVGVKQEKKREKKIQHWQGVIQSACEQSGRNRLPELRPLASLRTTLEAYKPLSALKLVLSPYAESGLTSLAEIQAPPSEVVILIGPEGGFSAEEIEYAGECGFVAVRVGPRVLRTETAGPAILSIVQMLWGDIA